MWRWIKRKVKYYIIKVVADNIRANGEIRKIVSERVANNKCIRKIISKYT